MAIETVTDTLKAARQQAEFAKTKRDYTNTSYVKPQTAPEHLISVTPQEPLVTGSTVYPDSLNFDASTKKPILTQESTSIEEHIYSQKYQAATMGAVHPVDIKPIYSNPNFPASLVDADPEKDPDGLLFKDNALLQKLATFATKEDFDGNIKQPSHDLDWRALLPDLNAMTFEGDPRWSLGHAVQNVFQKFWPEIQNYIDFLRSQGITVVNNYICDIDGNPIEEATVEALTKYNTNSDDSAPPIPTAQRIGEYFDKTMEEAFNRHADGFIYFIKNYYLEQGYFVEGYYHHPTRLFTIKTYITTYTGSIESLTYFKYYPDRIDYVINRLRIPFIEVTKATIPQVFNDNVFLNQMEIPIPDYTKYLRENQTSISSSDGASGGFSVRASDNLRPSYTEADAASLAAKDEFPRPLPTPTLETLPTLKTLPVETEKSSAVSFWTYLLNKKSND